MYFVNSNIWPGWVHLATRTMLLSALPKIYKFQMLSSDGIGYPMLTKFTKRNIQICAMLMNNKVITTSCSMTVDDFAWLYQGWPFRPLMTQHMWPIPIACLPRCALWPNGSREAYIVHRSRIGRWGRHFDRYHFCPPLVHPNLPNGGSNWEAIS